MFVRCVLASVHDLCMRKKEDDKSLFLHLPFVLCPGVDSLLALSQYATISIDALFVPVWRCLAAFLRFQLLYVSVGAVPFPGPSLHGECSLITWFSVINYY